MKNFKLPLQKTRAFTLLELLIVLLIIGILIAIGLYRYQSVVEASKSKAAQSDVRAVFIHANAFKSLNNGYTGMSLTNPDGITVDTAWPGGDAPENAVGVQVLGADEVIIATKTEDGKSFCIKDEAGVITSGVWNGNQCTADGTPFVPQPLSASLVQAGGTDSTCGIFAGRGYCWGLENESADGPYQSNNAPTLLPGVLADAPVTKIATSHHAACAVSGGELYCWGEGNYGVLGLGNETDQALPQKVQGALDGKTVTDVSMYFLHTCAIADGDVYCWGFGTSGQLGHAPAVGTYDPAPTTAVGGLIAGKTITDLKVGNHNTCVIADNQAYCFGTGYQGALGHGSSSSSTNPVAVGGALAGETVTDIDASLYGACAVSDGKVYCWGDNTHGKVGVNDTASYNTPQEVGGLLTGKIATKVDVGLHYTCAIADGGVYCWGMGNSGQLGNAADNQSLIPVAANAPMDTGVTDITAGNHHTCARKTTKLYCWGNGGSGQLGTGGLSYSNTPQEVLAPMG